MEWPAIEVKTMQHLEGSGIAVAVAVPVAVADPSSSSSTGGGGGEFFLDVEDTLLEMHLSVVTQEIYARAATASMQIPTMIGGYHPQQQSQQQQQQSQQQQQQQSQRHRRQQQMNDEWKNKVEAFLETLRARALADDGSSGYGYGYGYGSNNGNNGNSNDWSTSGYRTIARDFCELTASAPHRSFALALCRGGLEAVHDLMRYAVPSDNNNSNININSNNNSNNSNNNSTTERHSNSNSNNSTTERHNSRRIAPRDAFVLSQSFPRLRTEILTGTRAPDLGFRLGLLVPPASETGSRNSKYYGNSNSKNNSKGGANYNSNNRNNNYLYSTTSAGASENDNHDNHDNHEYYSYSAFGFDYDANALFGTEACGMVQNLYRSGAMEASAASLAKHTLSNKGLVSQLANTIFVVLGCDHPLAPTRALLRIPGVEVLGIPSSQRRGLKAVVEYVQYNSPDDTSLLYPTTTRINNNNNNNNNNSNVTSTTAGAAAGAATDNNNNNNNNKDSDNLILSRGPQVAQWILDRTQKSPRSELVLVPMPLPPTTLNANANASANASTGGGTVPESAVRWAAACDLIVQRVLGARASRESNSGSNSRSRRRRRNNNNNNNNNKNNNNKNNGNRSYTNKRCSLWSYQSPTTCMVVPPASTTKSTERLQNRPSHEQWLHALSRGSVLEPSPSAGGGGGGGGATATATATATTSFSSSSPSSSSCSNYNHEYSIVNGIITSEGPHHVLAEQIRLWRAMITHHGSDDDNDYGHGLSYGSDSDSDDDDYDDDYDDDEDDDYDDYDDGWRRTREIPVFAPYVPLLDTHNLEWSRHVRDTSILSYNTNTNTNHKTAKYQHQHPNDPWCCTPLPAGTASSLVAAIALAGHTDPLVHRPVRLLEGYDDGDYDDYNYNYNYNQYADADAVAPTRRGTTPFAMFWNGSVHSGVWNSPYTLESVRGTVGHVLRTVYEYYHHYSSEYGFGFGFGFGYSTNNNNNNNNNNSSSSAADSNTHSNNDNNNSSSDPSSSSLAATTNDRDRDRDPGHNSIVDIVPSSIRDEVRTMPDLVKERLELLA